VRNNPIYTIAATNINNLVPLFYTFSFIYIKNSFNFNFILLNCLIKGILTLIVLTTLIFIFKTVLLLYSWLITTYNYFFITT